MAEKSISLVEAQRLRDDGAEFEFEKEITSIERFDELIDTLRLIAANEQERIRADLARNQTNLEIMGSLQTLVQSLKGSNGGRIDLDLGPLEEILGKLTAKHHSHPLVTYDFEFTRDVNSGAIFKIRATPVIAAGGE